MFRYSSHLSDTEELVIFAVCLGPPLFLALWYWLKEKHRLRKFYMANQYRVIGEVLSARQVTAAEDAACWELTVRFENENGETETVRLSTYDKFLADARSVELAVIPDAALPQGRALDRVNSMNARELRHLEPEEQHRLAQEILLDAHRQMQAQQKLHRKHPGFGAERVRLWEERLVTSEQKLRRKRLGKKLLPALVLTGLAAAGMVILVFLAANR